MVKRTLDLLHATTQRTTFDNFIDSVSAMSRHGLATHYVLELFALDPVRPQQDVKKIVIAPGMETV